MLSPQAYLCDPVMETDPNNYPIRQIGELVPGPTKSRFTGTVVNLYSYQTGSAAPNAAKGCLRILLRDHGSEILVKLWFADREYDQVRLGTRITVACNHVSSTAQPGMPVEALRALPANLMVSIFPERDSGCAIEAHESNIPSKPVDVEFDATIRGDGYTSDCRMPVDVKECFRNELGINMNGVMGLEAFVNGAADNPVDEVKLLVAVIEVGSVKQVTTRNNTSFETLPLTVIDQSCLSASDHISQRPSQPATCFATRMSSLHENNGCDQKKMELLPCELSLSVSLSESCREFPIPTILLLTSPKLGSQVKRRIRLTSCSQIYVSPFALSEAIALHRWTVRVLPSMYPIDHTLNELVGQIESKELQYQIQGLRGSNKKRISFGPSTFDVQSPRPVSSQKGRKEKAVRRQFTLSLFLTQVQLRPRVPFRAYISVIIVELNLTVLWKAGKIFVGTCPRSNCRRRCYENMPTRVCCENCSAQSLNFEDEALLKYVCFNPQILGNIADDEAGIGIGSGIARKSHSAGLMTVTGRADIPRSIPEHNLLLNDHAMYGLTGLKRSDFMIMTAASGSNDRSFSSDTTTITHSPMTTDEEQKVVHNVCSKVCPGLQRPYVDSMANHLQFIEESLLWKRMTFVLGWTGEDENTIEEGKVIVMDVIS